MATLAKIHASKILFNDRKSWCSFQKNKDAYFLPLQLLATLRKKGKRDSEISQKNLSIVVQVSDISVPIIKFRKGIQFSIHLPNRKGVEEEYYNCGSARKRWMISSYLQVKQSFSVKNVFFPTISVSTSLSRCRGNNGLVVSKRPGINAHLFTVQKKLRCFSAI